MVPQDPIHREIAKEDFSVYFEDAKERLGHAISLGQSALRSLFLVNGGAILAMLTLVGNSNAVVEERALFWAFIWFGSGLISTLASSVLFAISQMFYMQSSNEEGWKAQAIYHATPYANDGTRDDRIGDLTMKGTIMLALLALILFLIGSFVALDAVT